MAYRTWLFGPAQGLEIIAGLGDLVTFALALALVFSPLASADYSLIVGNVMIANQVRGHLQRHAMSLTCSQVLRPCRPCCRVQMYNPASQRCEASILPSRGLQSGCTCSAGRSPGGPACGLVCCRGSRYSMPSANMGLMCCSPASAGY
jgi:hypothetical protein